MRLRPFILPLALVAGAAKPIELAATRNDVGPFEYLTMAAVVALLLLTALRLSRRALGRAS
jgi:hypothetical protein